MIVVCFAFSSKFHIDFFVGSPFSLSFFLLARFDSRMSMEITSRPSRLYPHPGTFLSSMRQSDEHESSPSPPALVVPSASMSSLSERPLTRRDSFTMRVDISKRLPRPIAGYPEPSSLPSSYPSTPRVSISSLSPFSFLPSSRFRFRFSSKLSFLLSIIQTVSLSFPPTPLFNPVIFQSLF